MKSFTIHVFWVVGVILFLDATGSMLSTGNYTNKDISLVILICATLIIISMLVKTLFTHKENPEKRGFFAKLTVITILFAVNVVQFLTILSVDDIYLLFS